VQMAGRYVQSVGAEPLRYPFDSRECS
jgi:hypothetical protein